MGDEDKDKEKKQSEPEADPTIVLHAEPLCEFHDGAEDCEVLSDKGKGILAKGKGKKEEAKDTKEDEKEKKNTKEDEKETDGEVPDIVIHTKPLDEFSANTTSSVNGKGEKEE